MFVLFLQQRIYNKSNVYDNHTYALNVVDKHKRSVPQNG